MKSNLRVKLALINLLGFLNSALRVAEVKGKELGF